MKTGFFTVLFSLSLGVNALAQDNSRLVAEVETILGKYTLTQEVKGHCPPILEISKEDWGRRGPVLAFSGRNLNGDWDGDAYTMFYGAKKTEVTSDIVIGLTGLRDESEVQVDNGKLKGTTERFELTYIVTPLGRFETSSKLRYSNQIAGDYSADSLHFFRSVVDNQSNKSFAYECFYTK